MANETWKNILTIRIKNIFFREIQSNKVKRYAKHKCGKRLFEF